MLYKGVHVSLIGLDEAKIRELGKEVSGRGRRWYLRMLCREVDLPTLTLGTGGRETQWSSRRGRQARRLNRSASGSSVGAPGTTDDTCIWSGNNFDGYQRYDSRVTVSSIDCNWTSLTRNPLMERLAQWLGRARRTLLPSLLLPGPLGLDDSAATLEQNDG